MRIPTALIALLVAAPAAAQDPPAAPRPTHVPIEFVEMLSVSPMSVAGTVMVGTLPDLLLRLLRPGPDVRIIGTMDYRLFSTSAVIVPGAPQAVQEQWLERLSEAGWVPAPEPDTRFDQGGFYARDRQLQNDDVARTWCAPDASAYLHVSAAARGADSTAFLFAHGTGPAAGMCRIDPGMRQMREYAPMPTLEGPEGGAQRRAGMSSGVDEATATAHVRSALSLAALAAHYASEMQRAGWSAGQASLGTDVIAQTFRFTDEDGAEWRGMLTATMISSRNAEVHLRIARVRE